MIDEQVILDHLIEIKESLAAATSKLDGIDRVVSGNGMPGLVQKVESLEANKNWTRGIGSAVVFILGLLEWLIHRK